MILNREKTFKRFIQVNWWDVQLKVACMLVYGLTKSIINNIVKSTKEILWWTKKSEICIECTWNDCKFASQVLWEV